MTAERLTIRPVQGRRVADPATGYVVPEEGLEVPRSPYWIRRIAEGGVVEVLPEPDPPTKPTKRRKAVSEEQ